MLRKIVVGVDIRDLRIAKTGSKTYLEEISFQLRNKEFECEFIFFDTIIPVYTGKYKIFKLLEHIRFFFWKQLTLPILAISNRCDVLFCTDYFLPYFSPGFKTVAVFYDAFFYEYSEHYNPYWLKLFKSIGVAAAKRAAFVVTITEYSRKRIAHFTGIKLEKIIAIHLAAKQTAIADPPAGYKPKNIQDKVILHVGTLEKRKNLLRLIEAFDILLKSGYQGYCLVLVGQPSPKQDMDDSVAILQLIKKLNLENEIHLTGYASDEDLAYFYKNAEMYIFPSINEGFGLPVLEAFHHKLPVILADNTCLPEVGGDAVLCFNPFDTNDIFLKMKMLIDDEELRNTLINKGDERLKLFTWEKNAYELVEVFKRAVMKI